MAKNSLYLRKLKCLSDATRCIGLKSKFDNTRRGYSETTVILDIYEEEVPYQQYAEGRTQFDEQAEAVAAMSSLSLQCLSSPSKRDSLDEGYDPDETLKIVVSSDGKKVDILRDSAEEE